MKYVFKITLEGLTEPTVWRIIEIPGYSTFFKFHKIIQLAFGWENLHFFEFVISGNKGSTHIYMPHEYDLDDITLNYADATKTKIQDIISVGTTDIKYHYDRNDNWIHRIELESISEDVIKHPKCLNGGGMCPPEGCNGAIGYEHIKKILNHKPNSDEARRCREWLFMEDDDVFDPDYFTDAEINEINDIYRLF